MPQKTAITRKVVNKDDGYTRVVVGPQLPDVTDKSKDIKEIPWFYIGRVDWKKKITSFVGAKFFDKKYKESF